MDIGLALQHFVGPEAAPLDLYPELYDLVFSPLDPSQREDVDGIIKESRRTAEVVRDRVGARSLARTLFLREAREHPTSSLAPKALLAAADLSSDSAHTLRATVRARYSASPYAQLLEGKSVSAGLLDADERLLRQVWTRATMIPDSASVATERRRP